jgi:2-polyprenyl-6-methoxyphenol hydroxylase-like FAD-dependent oxidoreductase
MTAAPPAPKPAPALDNSVSEERDAIVVGAGIGGLAAAVALRRAGWQVRIYERAPQARELGFGLLLAPNALAAVRELGVAGGLSGARVGDGPMEIRRITGARVRRFSRPLGGGSVVSLRSELHRALFDAAADTPIVFGSEAETVTDEPDGATLHLRDGRRDSATVLIGADGVDSVVRRTLHPNEAAARPSGYTAVRGVAYGATRHLGDLQAVAYLDDGMEVAAVRAGARGDAVYWYMSRLTADVPNATAASAVEDLARCCDPLLAGIMTATQPDDMRLDVLLRRDPLPTWGRGRVTLLGDAAHPVLPHTGQGAAQALEDAVALGLALDGRRSILDALRLYEKVRGRRTRRFVALGPRIARMTTTHSPAVDVCRTAIIRLVPEVLAVRASYGSGDPHKALR